MLRPASLSLSWCMAELCTASTAWHGVFGMGSLERPDIQRRLIHQSCPAPTLSTSRVIAPSGFVPVTVRRAYRPSHGTWRAADDGATDRQPSSPSQRPAATGVWTACIHGVLVCRCTRYTIACHGIYAAQSTEYHVHYCVWNATRAHGTPPLEARWVPDLGACEPRSRLDHGLSGLGVKVKSTAYRTCPKCWCLGNQTRWSSSPFDMDLRSQACLWSRHSSRRRLQGEWTGASRILFSDRRIRLPTIPQSSMAPCPHHGTPPPSHDRTDRQADLQTARQATRSVRQSAGLPAPCVSGLPSSIG